MEVIVDKTTEAEVAKALGARRNEYQFTNRYDEKFLVYQRNNEDIFYITGDEFAWFEYILIVAGLGTYTAFGISSWGFMFSAEENAELDRYINKYLVKKYKGVAK